MIKTIKKEVLLVGDIGGTTTTLGYLTEFNGSPKFRQLATYSSTEADGIGDILAQYLDQNRIEVKAACLGIAGPVMEGNCKTTNLPWEVSETALKKRFRWPKVKLINDLAATAVSIPFLGKDDTVSISPGKAVEKQTIALMAPGTGLGQSLLVWVKDHRTGGIWPGPDQHLFLAEDVARKHRTTVVKKANENLGSCRSNCPCGSG